MFTPLWGRYLWTYLHLQGYSLPEEITDDMKTRMRALWENLAPTLPCPGCRLHAAMHIREHPPNLESRDAYIDWLIAFHNAVNERTGKRTWTRAEVDELYSSDFLNMDRMKQLNDAEILRMEDHEKLQKVQEACDRMSSTETALIVVTSVLGLLCILFLMAWLRERRTV